MKDYFLTQTARHSGLSPMGRIWQSVSTLDSAVDECQSVQLVGDERELQEAN